MELELLSACRWQNLVLGRQFLLLALLITYRTQLCLAVAWTVENKPVINPEFNSHLYYLLQL